MVQSLACVRRTNRTRLRPYSRAPYVQCASPCVRIPPYRNESSSPFPRNPQALIAQVNGFQSGTRVWYVGLHNMRCGILASRHFAFHAAFPLRFGFTTRIAALNSANNPPTYSARHSRADNTSSPCREYPSGYAYRVTLSPLRPIHRIRSVPQFTQCDGMPTISASPYGRRNVSDSSPRPSGVCLCHSCPNERHSANASACVAFGNVRIPFT